MTHHEWDHVQSATQLIRARWNGEARVGIVLGTGLGALASEIDAEAVIGYADIPSFPKSTVESHKGQLVCGRLAGCATVAMEGRFHLYEGYSAAQVTFPVRVLKALGCEILIVSNACGGMNPMHAKGDIVVLDDHINLMGVNPLIGPNDERLGPRFPDMSAPYDRTLSELALDVALREGVRAHRGVYAAVIGPNLETRAEYRMLRAAGADVVGMSTVPEVLVAVHAGLKVLGFSIITDLCLPDALAPVELSEILAVAREAEGKLRRVVLGVLARLSP